LIDSAGSPSSVSVVQSKAFEALSSAAGPGVGATVVAGHGAGFLFNVTAWDQGDGRRLCR